VIALAELKQSKDILSGFLPISLVAPESTTNDDEIEELNLDDGDDEVLDPLGAQSMKSL
jgi:hypothetical protein